MSSAAQAQARAAAVLAQLCPAPTSGSTSVASSSVASESGSGSSSDGAPPLNHSTTFTGGRFQYTLDPKGLLTDAQRQFYDDNGYLLIKGLLSASEIEVWRERFVRVANGELETPPTMLVMRDIAIAKRKEKGEHAITKVQDFQDEPVLFTYCEHPAVLQYIESIIGSDVQSIHSMLINKPPDVGVGSSRHPPHQDLWYFPHRPPHMIAASWTAMQKIDRENGCLFVKPGSHKGQLLKHTYPNDGVVNKAYHGIHGLTEKDGSSMLHVEMDVGDTLFFHPLLVHGSGRNLSQRYRKAISCHYASSRCHFAELTGSIQEDVAREIEHMAKKKGAELAFVDIWKLKSRHLQGKEPDWAN